MGARRPRGGHRRGESERARAAGLGRPARRRRDAHQPRRAVAARLRTSRRWPAATRRARSRDAFDGGARRGIRQRQPRSHLRHPRPVARRLARRPASRRSSSSRTTSAAMPSSWRWRRTSGRRRRGRARCAGGTGWSQRQDDGLASDQYRLAEEMLGGRRLPALRAELLGATRAGEPAQLGVLGPAGVHRHRRRARTRTTAPPSARGTCATSTDTSTPRRRESVRWPDREVLDAETRAFEAIALGLRRVDGARAARIRRGVRRRSGGALRRSDPSRRGERASSNGTSSRLRLTPRGRLFASEACLAFLPARRPSDAARSTA